jgi:hypothetical protein
MVDVARNITITPFTGETYTFQAIVIGFHDSMKTVYVQQDDERGPFTLPLKLFDSASIHILRHMKLGTVAELHMATGMARKTKLKILTNGRKKERTVMGNTGIQGGIEIEEEKVEIIDPNRLTYSQVKDKLKIMGTIQKELSSGRYVIFTLKGGRLKGRIRGTVDLADYAHD